MDDMWTLYISLAALLIPALTCLLAVSSLVCARRKYSHLPSPKMSSRFFGHYFDIKREREKGIRPGQNPPDGLLLKWASDIGTLYILFLVWKPILIVLDPEDIQKVHMNRLHPKPKTITTIVGDVFGQRASLRSLFVLQDYSTWHPRRKHYDLAFSKSYLTGLVPTFDRCCEKCLSGLKPFADGVVQVPMKRHLLKFSQNTIWKVAFACDISDECDPTSGADVVPVGTKVFKAFQDKLHNFPFQHFQFFHPFECEGYRNAVRTLRGVGKECILKRMKVLDDGGEVPNDILTFILKSATTDSAVDIETLLDDFAIFYLAGQETVGNTLSLALVLVLQHPEVLERLLAEIDEVLGSRTSVTTEDLEKLKYTEQVVHETMRLYSPAGFMVVSKESPPGGVTLSGYHIPAGTHMATHPACVHRMPQYFEEPDSFNPSRFDPENKKPSPFIYFPFGVGHRMCIGMHFAMVEMKLMLCRLIQAYDITLPPNYKLIVVEQFIRQSHDDITCTLVPRK
eukprot:Em0004g413a